MTAEEKDVNVTKEQKPEKLRYSRYYEHDGMLRAYANRAMLLAFICVPSTLISLLFAVYVRVQPPTVIRVGANGETSIVGHSSQPSASVSVSQGASAEPTELERKAFVKRFLERYLNFSPAIVSHNWADSLNMMEGNLRQATLEDIEKNNLVGEIEDDQKLSELSLRTLEVSQESPLIYTAFGVRTVHQVRDHKESIDQFVEQYRVRLAQEKRSEANPSGLLIAEYTSQEIDGESRNSILQQLAK